jgi:hypothetical protein
MKLLTNGKTISFQIGSLIHPSHDNTYTYKLLNIRKCVVGCEKAVKHSCKNRELFVENTQMRGRFWVCGGRGDTKYSYAFTWIQGEAE